MRHAFLACLYVFKVVTMAHVENARDNESKMIKLESLCLAKYFDISHSDLSKRICEFYHHPRLNSKCQKTRLVWTDVETNSMGILRYVTDKEVIQKMQKNMFFWNHSNINLWLKFKHITYVYSVISIIRHSYSQTMYV